MTTLVQMHLLVWTVFRVREWHSFHKTLLFLPIVSITNSVTENPFTEFLLAAAAASL